MSDEEYRIRRNWNAPTRHLGVCKDLLAIPEESRVGPWWNSLNRIRKSASKGGFTYFICGPNDAGKTQMAVCLMPIFAQRLKTCFFMTAEYMFTRFTDVYRKKDVAMSSAYQELRNYKLLVIDEFARSKVSAFETRVFFEVINQRYGDVTSTIVTTNLSANEARALLGVHLCRRVEEAGEFIDATWPSPGKEARAKAKS